jgi:hypothetical protein
MSAIDSAIARLEQELEDLGAHAAATSKRPAEGTSNWFLLRAKATGLSLLRQMNQLELLDAGSADAHYRAQLARLKLQEPA